MTRTPQIEALPGMTPLGFKPKPKTPSLKTLERWLDQGVCKTLWFAVSSRTASASMVSAPGS
jgi:hypothetical protein